MESLKETVEHLEGKLSGRLPELQVERVAIGVFFTGVVLAGGHSGVAFTPIGEMPEAVCCPTTAARMPSAGALRGKPARELLAYAMDKNVLKCALGIATMNALSACLLEGGERDGFELIPGADAIEESDLVGADGIALVGAFTPFIRMLKKLGKPFFILEKKPDALRPEELSFYRPADSYPEVIPKVELVILTGVTIVNHTLDSLLSHLKPGARAIIAGPTASMVPQAFFRRGVSLMGGVRIYDPESLVTLLMEGGSGYHMFSRCAEKIVLRPKG